MRLLPWLVFALFALYLVKDNFHAALGIIDDHEIAMFLGTDGRVSLSDIPRTLLSTELGQWGTFLRYRPSYYLLRVLETAVWRDCAPLWYASRYVMLCVALFLGWKVLALFFPPSIAYLVVFQAMTIPFWPDVLTRLGLSESYAAPALLLFVYGMIRHRLWMLTLGYAICVGAKENLLFLFPLLLAWAVYRRATRQLTSRDLVATLILTAYTLAIAGAIIVATTKAGVDFYGAPISYRHRILMLLRSIPELIRERNTFPALIVWLAGTVVTLRLWRQAGWATAKSHPVPRLWAVMILLALMIASQLLFYGNTLPLNMRYDFPCSLFFLALDVVAFRLIIECFRHQRLEKPVILIVYAGMALICIGHLVRQGYSSTRTQAAYNVAVTREFAGQLNRASTLLRAHPERHVIFVSERFFDFEPIISVLRYLDSRGVRNPVSLHFTPREQVSDPLGKDLQGRLIKAMNGEAHFDGTLSRLLPYQEPKEPCFCITFRGAQAPRNWPIIAEF